MALGKSASTGSLRIAGAELSHIPKRAAQHGIFLSSIEVTPISLKPGQNSTQRQVYTEEAKQLQETYMKPDLPATSVYSKSVSNLLRPEDYMNPTKPIIPSEAPGGGGHWGTGHWKSEYASTVDHRAVDGATYHRQHGPSYQAMNPPTCVGMGALSSSYRQDFGLYGSDPREKVKPEDNKLPVFRTPLTAGTAKGTMHMPGYQGFLATNTRNPHVARVEMGARLRSTDKTNLAETFHKNVVGYSGHQPNHHSNGIHGAKPSPMTTSGRDFASPSMKTLRA